MQTDVSVIIPTYNEAGNISTLLSRLAEVLKKFSSEIIVVDDNSPDGTWEIVENLAETNPQIKIIRRLDERGLSSAVVTGMAVAVGSVMVVMDADLQHDESIIPSMVKSIQKGESDICLGSRSVSGGSYGEWSKLRRFMSWTAATLAKIMLPVNVSDPMSGFFAISRDSYKQCIPNVNPRGFKILLEFIGRQRGLKVKEIGYTFRLRTHGETKLSTSVIRNYLIALYDIRFGKIISPTFVLYGFVGLTGVVVNLAGFALGEFLDFPHIYLGLVTSLDPLYLSVPFGIQLSIFSNYVVNNYLTFYEIRHKGWANLRGVIVFELISLFGLIIQTAVFQFLHVNGIFEALGIAEAVGKYLSNGVGIIVATVSNYYLNVNFTWKK